MRTVRTMSCNRFYMLVVCETFAQWIAAGLSRSARSLCCLATNYSYTEATQLFEAGLESISNTPIGKHFSYPLIVSKSSSNCCFIVPESFVPHLPNSIISNHHQSNKLCMRAFNFIWQQTDRNLCVNLVWLILCLTRSGWARGHQPD
jgi:hypothetical protein